MKYLKFFIFMLMLALFSYADGWCITNVASIVSGNAAGTLIPIAFSLMILIIIVAYLASQILNKPEYAIFYKDELFHLGISALMLLFVGTIFAIGCTFTNYAAISTLSLAYDTANDAYGGGISPSGCFNEFEQKVAVDQANPTEMATCYLKDMEKDARLLLRITVNQEIKQQMWSSFSLSFMFPLMGGTTTPKGAYKKAYSMQYAMLYNAFILPSMVSIATQKLLVQFLVDQAIVFFLPVGILLRIFPPLRQVGNLFIAIALGLYLIIPISYSFNFAMYSLVFSKQNCQIYNDIVSDRVNGDCGSNDSLWKIARLLPQAFFLPNLTLALFVTYLSAANKALKVIG